MSCIFGDLANQIRNCVLRCVRKISFSKTEDFLEIWPTADCDYGKLGVESVVTRVSLSRFSPLSVAPTLSHSGSAKESPSRVESVALAHAEDVIGFLLSRASGVVQAASNPA
jgi:hypothetical protein